MVTNHTGPLFEALVPPVILLGQRHLAWFAIATLVSQALSQRRGLATDETTKISTKIIILLKFQIWQRFVVHTYVHSTET